jgi:hypothetical protein
MAFLGLLLLLVGSLTLLAGTLMIIAAAFRVSPLWGFGCLFGPIQLVFIIMNWDLAKRGVIVQVAGVAMVILGVIFTAAYPPQVQQLGFALPALLFPFP